LLKRSGRGKIWPLVASANHICEALHPPLRAIGPLELRLMPHRAKGVTTERQQAYHGQFCKTVICRFYLADACKKGSKCTFAHAVEELHDVPDLRKTALCKHWKRGLCTLSSEHCPFAHNRRELRTSAAFANLSLSKEAVVSSTPSSVSTRSPESADGSQSSPSPQASPRGPEHIQGAQAPIGRKPNPMFVAIGAKPEALSVQPRGSDGGHIVKTPTTLKEHEPAFVEVPRAASYEQPTACEEFFGARSKLMLESPEVRLGPAFSTGGVAPLAATGSLRAEGKSKLALSEWLTPWPEMGQNVSQAPGMTTPCSSGVTFQTDATPMPPGGQIERGKLKGSTSNVKPCQMRQRAEELRACASAAEKKAAAYAEEAAVLRSCAENAERELHVQTTSHFGGAASPQPRTVDLSSLLDGGAVQAISEIGLDMQPKLLAAPLQCRGPGLINRPA